jgi:hypothetical protein
MTSGRAPSLHISRRQRRELRAAVADLRASNVRAIAAADTALANIAAREAERPAREQRAREEGRVLAAHLLHDLKASKEPTR